MAYHQCAILFNINVIGVSPNLDTARATMTVAAMVQFAWAYPAMPAPIFAAFACCGCQLSAYEGMLDSIQTKEKTQTLTLHLAHGLQIVTGFQAGE